MSLAGTHFLLYSGLYGSPIKLQNLLHLPRGLGRDDAGYFGCEKERFLGVIHFFG